MNMMRLSCYQNKAEWHHASCTWKTTERQTGFNQPGPSCQANRAPLQSRRWCLKLQSAHSQWSQSSVHSMQDPSILYSSNYTWTMAMLTPQRNNPHPFARMSPSSVIDYSAKHREDWANIRQRGSLCNRANDRVPALFGSSSNYATDNHQWKQTSKAQVFEEVVGTVARWITFLWCAMLRRPWSLPRIHAKYPTNTTTPRKKSRVSSSSIPACDHIWARTPASEGFHRKCQLGLKYMAPASFSIIYLTYTVVIVPRCGHVGSARQLWVNFLLECDKRSTGTAPVQSFDSSRQSCPTHDPSSSMCANGIPLICDAAEAGCTWIAYTCNVTCVWCCCQEN